MNQITILGKYNQNDDLNRSKLLSVDVITTQKPIEDNISMKKEEL